MIRILKKIPAALTGELIKRKEACRICHETKGRQIGSIDYWDIRNSRLVKCENCGLTQLDPMLSETETAKGCLAYYIEESLRVSVKEQRRNLVRNFRRGLLFGVSLKKQGIFPKNVLELGPGSGYFANGLKYIFPKVKITVMDVNKEVLQFNEDQHQYETIETSLESYIPDLENQFDLIIARDIIEHVIDISKVVQNVKHYLKNGGYFHFITPNGHEDAWKHYIRYNDKNKTSELLINHVNYFDGRGLSTFLVEKGFTTLQYFTYKLKTTRQGRGWRVSKKLMAPVSQKKSASFYINEQINKVRNIQFDKNRILDKWYLKKNRNLFAYLISWYHHAHLLKINPELNIGHEIYGLFKISKLPSE
jgi:SAM-dependent methyltransferase